MPLSDPPGAPDIVAAVDVFDAAYRAHYLAAGDEWDHREALRAGLEAVLAWRRDQIAAERERHPLYAFAYVPTSGTVNAPALPLPHAGSGDREEPATAACAVTGSIPPGPVTAATEFVFVNGQAFVNAAKHEEVVGRVAVERDDLRDRMNAALDALHAERPDCSGGAR